ncbi:response regulator [Spirosoma panaciterrae]|uniref:response regulator n=1 Tax=Spirosoma panaciterrae TaxID=496058 RepID=UPI00037DC75A|nr:response regulator [Spirosoma panaciterrae]
MFTQQNFDVLVVEDDQPTFELLQRLAAQQFPEATFISTTSPSSTFDYLNTHPSKSPKLILLDIALGSDVDGFTLLSELRTRFNGQVPIIMLTNSENPQHVWQSYATGATAFTTKPATLQDWKLYMDTLKSYWYDINTLPAS